MVVPSQVISDPAVAIRIAITTITVAALIGVVAAGIAVGVIVGRQSDFENQQIVLRSDFSVAIDRLITTTELQEFYDATQTLDDVEESINGQITLYFPQTSIKVVISAFSGQPILVSSLSQRRKKQLGNRPSIVTANGTAYFTKSYTSNQLLTAFSTYTQTIVLVNIKGGKSAALGTFSSKYSVFTNTYTTDLTVAEVDAFNSIATTNYTINAG